MNSEVFPLVTFFLYGSMWCCRASSMLGGGGRHHTESTAFPHNPRVIRLLGANGFSERGGAKAVRLALASLANSLVPCYAGRHDGLWDRSLCL
jgi:hypothetical protein